MFRIFETFLIGFSLLCINLIVVVVGTMIGWLPGILRATGALIRSFLFHSYEAYKRLFNWLAPMMSGLFGIDIMSIWMRVVAGCVTSTLILGLLVLIMGWSYSIWLVTLAALHGAVVGTRWEQLDRSAGFRFGVDL